MRAGHSILIVDDQTENLQVFAFACKNLGFEVTAVDDPTDALKTFLATRHEVVLARYEMSPIDGVDLVDRIHAVDPSVRSILMAEKTDDTLARFLGETDSATLMLKPIQMSELIEEIRSAADKGFGAATSLGEVAMSNKMDQCLPLLGTSREVREARGEIARLAKTSEPVLLEGPYGIGKPDVAKFLHYSSSYSDRPIVLCACDQMNREKVEKELISSDGTLGAHVEAARNGTLLITHIEALPLDLQVVLAKNFKELTRLCRVVTCANSMMDDLLESGQIDTALYFQLTLHVIHLPGLAARPIDIEAITRFVAADPERYGLARKMDAVEVDFLVARLRRSELRGNLRELIQRVRAGAEAEPVMS
ncbi:MAG: response regulator [Verrucomicrobia bacterium]|jgi:DNA-binding NtrC family response regulator|nr:response regulator [Verrucomicrobiota bacterium]